MTVASLDSVPLAGPGAILDGGQATTERGFLWPMPSESLTIHLSVGMRPSEPLVGSTNARCAGGLRGASPPAPESRVPANATKDRRCGPAEDPFWGQATVAPQPAVAPQGSPQCGQRTTGAIAVRASKIRQCPSHRASSASCRIPRLPKAGWAYSAAWSGPTGGSAPCPGLTAGHILERVDAHPKPRPFRGSRAILSGAVRPIR